MAKGTGAATAASEPETSSPSVEPTVEDGVVSPGSAVPSPADSDDSDDVSDSPSPHPVTVGRIVHYHFGEADLDLLAALPIARNAPHAPGTVLAALVTAVNDDGTVHLRVHLDGLDDLWVSSEYGYGEGQWFWPDRV